MYTGKDTGMHGKMLSYEGYILRKDVFVYYALFAKKMATRSFDIYWIAIRVCW